MELIEAGKSFVTEAIFVNGGRADILVLDDWTAIEIVYTETEESLIRKTNKYPRGIKIQIERVK